MTSMTGCRQNANSVALTPLERRQAGAECVDTVLWKPASRATGNNQTAGAAR